MVDNESLSELSTIKMNNCINQHFITNYECLNKERLQTKERERKKIMRLQVDADIKTEREE